ncbi:3-deoxy-D-manno-octulosonic acid transferase [Asticcacaulis sp. AC402]|uniref:3-deoxy-D-manno-octulosonic acid transferase n=1 Tax=Asticcacaulis sp. AC402 TaxID=1282361 RepID=UPI0003C40AE6|nr:3-deoxy-D-manno-octulosonic acid transferase [Asticcacaulis sp. AC402]ESQ73804.1 3-deoxy-D-manno-octulosonic acid transferase [Asticcacaulis sp. AC402]
MTVPLKLYRHLMGIMHGFAPGLLKKRAARGKEDPQRLTERLGRAGMARPDGPLVWFHGVSVGESVSALPVITRLLAARPDIQVLVTTATTTSAEILANRLPAGVIHHFVPIDTPQAVTAFLDHWRPSLAVFIESDIWPTLLSGLSARSIAHALLSARITEKTFRGWQAFPKTMKRLLSGYSLVMAQDGPSEDRLTRMGATVGARANLKTLGEALPVNAATLADMRSVFGTRRVIVAASTHYGEDSLISKILEPYIREGDLLVLVPRHPIKAGEIQLDIESLGLSVARRALKDPVTGTTQVYLADTLGELGLWFSLADIVVMGGSFLTGIGGHNPLEAARLGKSVITGPDISNWDGIFGDLIDAGAAFRVQGVQELGFMVGQLRDHPEAITAADQAALDISRREAGTLDTVWQALEPLLPADVKGNRE